MEKKKVYLVLFAGQSNMAGRGVVCERWPKEAPAIIGGAAYEYRAVSAPGKLFPLEEPFGLKENRKDGIWDIFEGGAFAKTGSLVTAFCNAFYEKTKIPIVGVSASKGGSHIAQWLPDAKEGYLKDAVGRLREAKEYLMDHAYEIEDTFILWCQGESDGDLGTDPKEYRGMFERIWQEFQREVSRLYMILIGECNIPENYTRYDGIRGEQRRICEGASGVVLASDAFVNMRKEGLMKDAFHYYQEGYNRCGADAGRRVAEEILTGKKIQIPEKLE